MKNFERMKVGIQRMREKKVLLLFPAMYLIIIGLLVYMENGIHQKLNYTFSTEIFYYLFLLFMAEMAIIGSLGIFMIVGYPLEARRFEKQFLKIGFVDKSGFTPMLLSKRKNNNGSVLTFFSDGIPLSEYKTHSEDIETALNLKIADICYGKDMRHVVIKAIAAVNQKQGVIIRWDDKYLSNKDFELVLGEDYFGVEKIDIATTPHILIGGGTGSGKSKLLKLLLMESIKKSAIVYLADFKGGVDYPKIWHEKCSIITEPQQMEKQLEEILSILEERRMLLVKAGTPNISEYNEKTHSSLQRIIIACDEIAEVLDKTGLEKEEKSLVGRIESKFSTIARLGRAFGIHLIFATQRPDADILKGQIKNNIGYRVCGRADKVLSQIILDNSEAVDKISPNDQGMFLTNTGTLFKAYYIEDDCLEEGGADGRQAGN